jgi:hypothetical protein
MADPMSVFAAAGALPGFGAAESCAEACASAKLEIHPQIVTAPKTENPNGSIRFMQY